MTTLTTSAIIAFQKLRNESLNYVKYIGQGLGQGQQIGPGMNLLLTEQ